MSLFGEIAGAVGSLGGLATGIAQVSQNNYWANKNYENMQAQQDYEKSVQRTQWNREDTAVQRRVADLKAAGLSPVLAAGSSAQTGAPIHVTTPQRDPTDITPIAEETEKGAQAGLDAAAMVQNLITQKSMSDYAKAQARKMAADADVAEHDAGIYTKSPFPSDSPGWWKAGGVVGSVLEKWGLMRPNNPAGQAAWDMRQDAINKYKQGLSPSEQAQYEIYQMYPDAPNSKEFFRTHPNLPK